MCDWRQGTLNRRCDRRREAGEEFSNVNSEEFCAYYLSEAGEFVKLLRSLIANKKVN